MEALAYKKIFPYLRIIICISFVVIWTIWLISLPSIKEQKTDNLEQETKDLQKKTEDKFQNLKIYKPSTKGGPDSGGQDLHVHTTKHLHTPTHKQHIFNELPKLANLAPVKEKLVESKTGNDFLSVAQATRKALLNDLSETSTEATEELSLRKKIPLKKQQGTNLEKDWLPKYVIASKQLAPKVENTINNLDKIANQIELIGLIQNPDGKGAAIIRNKTNNKIEILKNGEDYQELKLLEIKNNEITLGNLNLNKTYVKKIVTK